MSFDINLDHFTPDTVLTKNAANVLRPFFTSNRKKVTVDEAHTVALAYALDLPPYLVVQKRFYLETENDHINVVFRSNFVIEIEPSILQKILNLRLKAHNKFYRAAEITCNPDNGENVYLNIRFIGLDH